MTATVADLYLRKSTADGGKSVGQQDDEVTDAVLAEGWTVGRKFTDDARSASRYARGGRPDFDALLAHITSGLCAVLAVWEASRASRRESTFFALLEACRDAGTLIFVMTHGRAYDVRKRSDWKALAREALDAADYSAAISESSTRGKRLRARAGLPDGKPLDGYRTIRDELGKATGREIDEPRAAVVRRMAREVLAGRTNSAIARGLNADGLLTARGTKWQSRDITRTATNPAYAALRVYRVGRDDEQVFEGTWAPIIDRDDHRKLVARLRDPSRLKHHGTEPVWLLSGIAVHGGGCGGPVRAKAVNKRPRYVCRTCNGLAIGATETDEFVADVVRAGLRRPEAAEWFAPRTDDAAIAAAEQEKAALVAELDEWRALAKARRVTPASFADFEADLLPKIEAADKRVRELSMPAALAHLAGVDVDATWDSLSVAVRREIVRRVMRVTLLPAERPGQRWRPERVLIERA